MNEEKVIDRIVEIGFGIAVIAVIVLKICGVITISWLWLLAPLWIPFAAGIILGLILGIWCLIDNYRYDKKKEKEYERY